MSHCSNRQELKAHIKDILRNTQGNYDGNIETLIDDVTSDETLISLLILHLKEKYGVGIKKTTNGYMFCMNNEEKFNLSGYNLLFNLIRICEILKEDLR